METAAPNKIRIYTGTSRDQAASDARSSTKRQAKRKRWLIAILIVLILTPIAAWCGLIVAGNQWIDEAELNTYYEQIYGGASPSKGQIIVLNDEMPAYISETLLAIEDHRFYMHPGVDPIGIVRSVWVDVNKGHKAQGGSTLTMQLARNLFLTQDKTFIRKFKEIAIAANLEWRYSKEEILNMYMNKVYFGHGMYGIESAANYYFGKTTKADDELPTLTQAETAMLVGLLKAPERYSPYKHPELAEERQQVVLNRMHELNWLPDVEWMEATHETVHLNPAHQTQTTMNYTHDMDELS